MLFSISNADVIDVYGCYTLYVHFLCLRFMRLNTYCNQLINLILPVCLFWPRNISPWSIYWPRKLFRYYWTRTNISRYRITKQLILLCLTQLRLYLLPIYLGCQFQNINFLWVLSCCTDRLCKTSSTAQNSTAILHTVWLII